MFQYVQDLMVIVFGLVIILLLLLALRSIHRQAEHMKRLETELSANEQTENLVIQEEEKNGEKSILR